MRVCGLDVDFLNLRGEEVYEQGSRIPTTRFGTPREDAERRDFTMNSLFYNLHTQSVEDWLDRGLTDLREERLVTPLNALRTFEDDPLRVLRAIRFAVRYKFDLHPDIRHAATHHEIHRALHVKISRERVGKELESMLSGKNARPVAALMTLSDLMLAGSVFCLPLPEINSVRSLRGSLCGYPFDFDTLEGAESEPARLARSIGWQAARAHLDLLPDAMESFLREESRLSLLDDAAAAASAASPVPQSAATDLSSPTRVDRRLLPLATFLLPFRTLHYYHTRKHPNRPVNAVTYIMREGIKFKNSDSAIVTTLMENVEAVAAFLRKYRERQLGAQNKEQQRQQEQTAQQLSSCRLEAGLLLRSLKESWVTCLLLAVVLLQRQQSQVDGATGAAGEPSAVEDWISAGLSLYRHVVIDHRLDRSWTIRPLIDGAALSRALQVPKGPLVAQYLREQVHWMLLNPDGTREGCEAHLALLHKRRLEEVGNAGSQTSSARTSEGEGGGGAPGSGATSEDDGGGMDDVDLLGISDGTGKTPSSPASGRRNRKTSRHFSKKMHVESMDLS
jgi:tRNA nucleotidyltransferase (CCA-adding enzyme)